MVCPSRQPPPSLTELQPQGLCAAHSPFSQYPGDSFANFTQVYMKPSPPREALLEASLPCHPMPFISLLSIYLAPLDTPQLYLLLPPNQNITTTEAGFVCAVHPESPASRPVVREIETLNTARRGAWTTVHREETSLLSQSKSAMEHRSPE